MAEEQTVGAAFTVATAPEPFCAHRTFAELPWFLDAAGRRWCSVNALARVLGVTHQSLIQWVRPRRREPGVLPERDESDKVQRVSRKLLPPSREW